MVEDLTETTFDEAVGGATGPVLVDFWAEWCGPCHTLARVLEEVAAERQGALRIYAVDTDAHPDLARRYGVMSMPTLLVFRHGELVQRLIGSRGKQHLLAELDPLLSAPPVS